MTEWNYPGTCRIGAAGHIVKRIQEWLCYHGHGVAIDQQWGPATEAALSRFLARPSPVVLDLPAWDKLVTPMVRAVTPVQPCATLAETVVMVARQHLSEHPVEIGGENAGPWVRLYMNTKEGRAWPWCAGFATYVLQQAAAAHNVKPPHPRAFGCDFLAGEADKRGLLLRVDEQGDAALVKPGFLFLVRRTSHSWAHIGIVEAVDGETMTTCEGNTNDSGSAEGFEVCRRTRTVVGKDYLIVSGSGT